MTMGDALNEYLLTLKPEQRRTHEPYVRKYVEYAGESQVIADLRGSRVESYSEAQIRSSDPNAPERVAALKAWFQFLKKKDYAIANYGINIRARRPIGKSVATSGPRSADTPIEMTADGLHILQKEMAELEVQKVELIKAIDIARQDGDLRENAPYHAAREALAFASQRHRQIETSLKRAVVVERTGDDRSAVGSTVTVTNLDLEKSFDYQLVSAREANAIECKISVESPVGKQLLGRRAGEEVAVTTPRGAVRFRIEAVAQA